MAETLTPHYSWIKPDVGGDASTWGVVLNTTFDAIDSAVWENQKGIVPIGGMQMFAGATLPTNWLWCNGAVYLDTDIPLLAPILNKKYAGSDSAHNAVPNLNARSPVGTDFSAWPLGLQGGEQNHTIAIAELPVHTHAGSQDAHSHPGSYQDAHVHVAWQDPHQHSIPQSAHAHGITTGGHSHAIHTGGHSHSYNQWGTGSGVPVSGSPASYLQQNVAANTGGAGDLGGNADFVGNLGGSTDAQFANFGNTDVQQPTTYTDTRQPALHIDTQAPVVTIGNTGSGTAANNMPPYTTVAFIIRYR